MTHLTVSEYEKCITAYLDCRASVTRWGPVLVLDNDGPCSHADLRGYECNFGIELLASTRAVVNEPPYSIRIEPIA